MCASAKAPKDGLSLAQHPAHGRIFTGTTSTPQDPPQCATAVDGLVIHAPTDLRLDEQDAGEIGPGQVLVRVGFGGICGSDLHYFHHGGFGTVRIQQPMVLGHEVAGSVAAVADDVTSVQVGLRVAVNPSRLVATIAMAAARAGSGACAKGAGGQVEYRV